MEATSPKPNLPSPHIAILPSPGMGHLIPLTNFAKKLHHRHQISTTFIIPSDGPLSTAQKTFLSSLPSAIDYLLLPPVSFDDMPKDVKIETLISLTVTRSLSSIHQAVKTLHQSKNLSAMVFDLFGTDGFEIAREFNIPCYIFYPTNGTVLSFFLNLPKLDETVSSEYRDVKEKLQIPGSIPIHGKDLLDPVQDRKNDAYKWVLHHAKRYKLADGIMVNSFKELEPIAFDFLEKKEVGKPIVYPIGPLIQMGSLKSEKDEVLSTSLTWLKNQPICSVLFVSFGSGGTLSHKQIIELALGLEMSEQKFLWIVRCPNDQSSSATYFNIQDSSDPLAYLPDGFLERTNGQGLVVPLWAPQAEILSHESTGAFMSHCGWNSILESVVNGVPLVAWPLYAEQRTNAVILHEDVKVALRPKVGEDGLVGRVEIASVVKSLMEGEEGKGIRSRMRILKDASTKVLGEDGSSTRILDELVNKWKKSNASAEITI